MSLVVFFFLDIVAEHADEDRDDAQHLAHDRTYGDIDDVVDQPRRGADQTEAADRLGALQTEADGGSRHADHRQQLKQSIGKGEGLAKHSECQNVGGNECQLKENQPCDVLGMESLLVHIDDGAESGDGIQNAAYGGAQHKEADGEQHAAEHLAQDDAVRCLSLERKNVASHGKDTDALCDDIIKLQGPAPLFLFLLMIIAPRRKKYKTDILSHDDIATSGMKPVRLTPCHILRCGGFGKKCLFDDLLRHAVIAGEFV